MDATAPQAFDIRVMNASASFLFVLAAFAFAGLVLMWLARLPLFSIRGIQIEGDVSRNSVTTIRANAAARLAGNFFTMDLALSQQAFEAVPWVRRALVRRVWPNRLAVQLEEHKAAAYWHREDRDDQLVNTFGEVFDVNLGDVEDDTLTTLRVWSRWPHNVRLRAEEINRAMGTSEMPQRDGQPASNQRRGGADG